MSLSREVASGLREAARDLKGKRFTLIRSPDEDRPPWQQDAGNSPPVAVWGVASNVRQNAVDGTTTQAGDLMVSIEKVSPPPKITDQIQFDGLTYTVMDVIPVAPVGVPIYFKLQCRR